MLLFTHSHHTHLLLVVQQGNRDHLLLVAQVPIAEQIGYRAPQILTLLQEFNPGLYLELVRTPSTLMEPKVVMLTVLLIQSDKVRAH